MVAIRVKDDELMDGYVNNTEQHILPAASRFLTAAQVAAELGISRSFAYKKIREVNQELAKQGFMTFSGRVLKSAWIAKTGG